MVTMPMARLLDVVRELADTGQQVKVLWQEGESLAFVAKGRDYRSEFHVNVWRPVVTWYARTVGRTSPFCPKGR